MRVCRATRKRAGARNLDHADGAAAGAGHRPAEGPVELVSRERPLPCSPKPPQLCPTPEAGQQLARLPPLAHGWLCPQQCPLTQIRSTGGGCPRAPMSLQGHQAVVTSRVGGKAGGRSPPTQSRASPPPPHLSPALAHKRQVPAESISSDSRPSRVTRPQPG